MSDGEQGEQIVDNYRLISLIASGNASNIWEVAEQGGTQSFAMKLLLPESLSDPTQKQTLKHEMKIGKLFSHPNFVAFHKLSITKTHAYLIMDYFRAPNLKSQLSQRSAEVLARFPKLVETICLSLGHMHEAGWLHRDIKPENILFSKSSELRLIDFSLSTRAASGLGKLVGGKAKIIQGTRTYIAPETLLKKKPTEQTDMYSLGITLYECLTGQPPFRGSSPRDLLKRHLTDVPLAPSELNENVTPEMDAFLLRMLSKKPADRHENMNEVAAEFRSLKPFKEDITDRVARLDREQKAADEDQALTLATRLDSRQDAERTRIQQERGIPVERIEAASKPEPKPEPKPAAAAMPGQPMPGQPMPGQPMPGQPMPGQPMMVPGMGYPQQMPPGYAAPGTLPAGYPPPGYMPGMMPAAPPQGYPGQPMPGQPMPGQPMPGQAMPGQPMPGQALPGSPPEQPPSPQLPASSVPAAMPPQTPVPHQPSAPQPFRPAADPAGGVAAANQPQSDSSPKPVPLHDARTQSELHPSQSEDDGELPLMEELPDVM